MDFLNKDLSLHKNHLSQLFWVKSDDLSVLWYINHFEYVSLEYIFWLQSSP